MSDEEEVDFKARIEAAFAELIEFRHSGEGMLVTEWIVAIQVTNLKSGEDRYDGIEYLNPSHQSRATSLGLAVMAGDAYRNSIRYEEDST